MGAKQLNLLTGEWEGIESREEFSEGGVKGNEGTEEEKITKEGEVEVNLFDCNEGETQRTIGEYGRGSSIYGQPP